MLELDQVSNRIIYFGTCCAEGEIVKYTLVISWNLTLIVRLSSIPGHFVLCKWNFNGEACFILQHLTFQNW